MVGARKLILGVGELGEAIRKLLKEYNTLEISCIGSPIHAEARLSKDEVRVKAFNKRSA